MDRVARGLALSKVTRHVKTFGAKGDGNTPDDDAFDKMVQFFQENPGGIVEFDPDGVYVIERNHYFPSHVNLRFNKATLWSRCDSGGVDNSVDRNIGMLNFWGTLDPVQHTVLSVAGLEGDYFGTDSLNLPMDGKLTIADASSYSVGDYIYFDINTGGYKPTALNPKEKKILKIIYKSGNTLTVDYTSPWRYQDYTFFGSIRKVYPCENVSIHDVLIYDELIVDAPKDPNVNTPGTENFVSCLSFNYAYNIEVKRVRGKNTKFPIVHVFNTTLGVVEDGYVEKPAVVGSGEGYFAQFVHCKDIKISRIYGDESRHLVDFTNCAFSTADTGIGYRTYATAFQLHGHYEHNITFKNTVGNMGLSSGQTFGEANTRVTLENHTGWISGGYLGDYKIVRSKIRMRRIPYGLIENSEIYLFLDSPYVQDSRVPKSKRKTEFKNCAIDVYASSNISTISDMALLSFEGGKIVSSKNPTSGFVLTVTGIDDLKISNITEVRGILLRPGGTSAMRISVSNANVFSGNIDAYFIEAKNATGGAKINVRLDRVRYSNERADGQKGKFIRFPSNDATNTGAVQELIINTCDIDSALITGDLVSGALNDVYLSTGNKISNSTVTVNTSIAHYKSDDLVFLA